MLGGQQRDGSMSISNATKEMKLLARDFYGSRYVAPMAAALGTDGYTLKRWGRGTGPANLRERLAKLVDYLLEKHLLLTVRAAEWRIRLRAQSDIVDMSMVARLREIQRELAPAKATTPEQQAAAAAPPDIEQAIYIDEESAGPFVERTIDEICAGRPAWQQAQIRELEERPY
jgi:hypothetical protein